MKIERQIELAKEIGLDKDLADILCKIAMVIRISTNSTEGNIELTSNDNSGEKYDVQFKWKANLGDTKDEK
jgi:hypothetical protein